MSDQAEKPGWWQASDGNWYPPEAEPGPDPSEVDVAAAGVVGGRGIRRGEGAPYTTSLPPAEAASVIVNLLTTHGAVVTSHTSEGIAGYVPTKGTPSIGVAFLWWLLCIVPAVLYWVKASKDIEEPFSIMVSSDGAGTALYPTGQGRGRLAVEWAATQLPD